VLVALFIQHAKRVCLIILPSVACLAAVPLCFTFYHKRYGFRGEKKKLLNIKCILLFLTKFV